MSATICNRAGGQGVPNYPSHGALAFHSHGGFVVMSKWLLRSTVTLTPVSKVMFLMAV